MPTSICIGSVSHHLVDYRYYIFIRGIFIDGFSCHLESCKKFGQSVLYSEFCSKYVFSYMSTAGKPIAVKISILHKDASRWHTCTRVNVLSPYLLSSY